MTANGLRVMGVDPGLTRCGLSVADSVSGRNVLPVAVGVARTPSDVPIEDRMLRLSNVVEQWMDKYDPDVMAIERLFERSSVSTVLQTAHGVGVIMLAAARRGIPVHQYTPSEVKKALTGNGRADKAQMTQMVTRVLGLSEAPQPADAADALALAVCHCWRAPMLERERAAEEQAAKQRAKFRKLEKDSAAPAAAAWRAAVRDVGKR